jgi:hypothetical protein
MIPNDLSPSYPQPKTLFRNSAKWPPECTDSRFRISYIGENMSIAKVVVTEYDLGA